MTSRASALLLVVALVATVALAVGAATARAESYGCVSKAQCLEMERLIRAKFPGHVEDTMVCIARRESGLNPRAANWTDTRGGSFGLFQVNGAHGPGGYATRKWVTQMWVPWRNVVAAWRLWRGAGLAPWGGGC